jgi:GntR family transcriptional regulator
MTCKFKWCITRGMTKPRRPNWVEDVPIYRQLMDVLVMRILDQVYLEDEMLPSVRQLALDCDVNPLTVAKAYKELGREGFTEKYRGEGLMLRKGVRDILLRREKSRFMKEELPVLRSRLKRLGIDLRTLAGAFED